MASIWSGLALSGLMITAGAAQATDSLHWVGCGISKKAYAKDLAQAYTQETGIKVKMDGGGATRGIQAVSSQQADLGGSCRPRIYSNAEERDTRLVPVAWDALAVIVHPNNPIQNLTLDQVRYIYEGKIDNWSQLGGKDKPIELFTRSSAISGVGYTIRSLVFGSKNASFGRSNRSFPSSGPLEKAVEISPFSLAITGISSARKRDLKVVPLVGRLPTYSNVKDGNYLLYRPLYLTYNPKADKDGNARAFIRFALSDSGQDIMRQNGTVPYLEALALHDTTHLQRHSYADRRLPKDS